MEELFQNFAEHIGKMLCPHMERMIKEYLKDCVRRGYTAEEYSNVERDIKEIMAQYFQRASDREYLEMATNLFNAYVENDDENLIRAVKYFIRIYTYFQNVNLKKRFYKWRINALYCNSSNNTCMKQKRNANVNTNNNIARGIKKSNSGNKLKVGNTAHTSVHQYNFDDLYLNNNKNIK